MHPPFTFCFTSGLTAVKYKLGGMEELRVKESTPDTGSRRFHRTCTPQTLYFSRAKLGVPSRPASLAVQVKYTTYLYRFSRRSCARAGLW